MRPGHSATASVRQRGPTVRLTPPRPRPGLRRRHPARRRPPAERQGYGGGHAGRPCGTSRPRRGHWDQHGNKLRAERTGGAGDEHFHGDSLLVRSPSRQDSEPACDSIARLSVRRRAGSSPSVSSGDHRVRVVHHRDGPLAAPPDNQWAPTDRAGKGSGSAGIGPGARSGGGTGFVRRGRVVRGEGRGLVRRHR